MRKKHVAFFSPQLHGHINPTLPIVSELCSRSYRVTYFISTQFKMKVAKSGAEPIEFSPQLLASHIPRLNHDPEPSDYSPGMIEQKFDTALAYYQDQRPDLIIYDNHAFEGRILAKTLDIPAIQTSPTFAPYKNYFIRDSGVYVRPEQIVAFYRKIDELLDRHGFKGSSFHHVEATNIHFIPPCVQCHAHEFSEQFHFVGPIFPNFFNATPSVTKAPADKVILVSATTGTTVEGDYFNHFIDALGNGPYHVILCVGNAINSSDLRSLPSNFVINREAPLMTLLPKASLFIGPGGITSIFESIYHEVPFIMIPGHYGNEEISFRFQELGLGETIDRRMVNGETIASAARTALEDSSLPERIKRFKREMLKAGGLNRAIEIIESKIR